MAFRETKDGLWVNVEGEAPGALSPFSPEPMPGVDWSEFRRTGIVAGAVPTGVWSPSEVPTYLPARVVLTRWILASLAVIALSQGCQGLRVLRSAEAMRVGHSRLSDMAARGWSAVAWTPEEANKLQREHGRILRVHSLSVIEILDRGDGTHFDSLYRLDCERGAVDVDYCLVLSRGKWHEHERGVEPDLQDP